MKALDIKCPVEACSVPKGQYCKLVDMVNNKFVGRFHLARVRAAAVAEHENNLAAASSNKGE